MSLLGRSRSDVAVRAARLRTMEVADPHEQLGRALEILREVGEADEAHFYRPVLGPGRPMTARSLHIGSDRARRSLERFHAGRPADALGEIGSNVFEPAAIERRELHDFLERRELLSDDRFYGSAVFEEYLAPVDLGDFQRLLVAHRGRLAGWVGIFRRRGSRPFDASDRRRLRPLVAPISAVVAASARRDALGPGVAGDLVVGPDGAVAFASADAKQWLAFRGFEEALKGRIRDLDRGVAPDPVFVLDAAAEAHATRLDGSDGVRYLVSVRPARGLALPETTSSLTAAERGVAELAASGASAAEIAQRRGTCVGTVKNQLKRIYTRLEVSNRLELARALEGARCS